MLGGAAQSAAELHAGLKFGDANPLFLPPFLSHDPLLSIWRDLTLRLGDARCRWGHRVGWVLFHFQAARGKFWSSVKPCVG